MIVVSNTSPIINLAAVEQLPLLEQLYYQISIAQAVYDEIVVAGAGLPGADAVSAGLWIERKAVTNTALVTLLEADLDKGEAATIALALEVKADLVLLDEKRGRQIANRLGLKVVGIIGILIEAKNRGLILLVKPVLDELMAKAGFWVSPAFYADILQLAGETAP
jgi:predicted nucleic acid-binding protein